MQKKLGTSLVILMLTSFSALGVVSKKDYVAPQPNPDPIPDIKVNSANVTAPNPNADMPSTNDMEDLQRLNEQLEQMLAQQQQGQAQGQTSDKQPQKRKRKTAKEMRREDAFEIMLENLLPLTPDEIITVRKMLDANKKAAATPANPPPTPSFSSTLVNLAPGAYPPVIRLSAGFVSSLLFIDSTGAPWPIAAYSLGDPVNFNIQWDQKSNTLFIQSLKEYAHTNMAIQLANLNTPVMLTLVSGQKNVDFRIDMQVTGRGPNAKPLITADTLYDPQVNPTLMNIMDGIPPKMSKKLTVSGGHGDAWMANNRLYFRTKLTLLSPAWTSSITSPDGTRVYEMMPTPHILASGDGKTIDIKLTGM